MRYLFILLIFVGCGSVEDNSTTKKEPSIHTNFYDLDDSDGNYYSVLDGDTIKVKFDGKLTTIRLIGIDTFETHKNNKAYRQAYENNITVEEVVKKGNKAKEYIKNKLSSRDDFYFEYDEGLFDRYKRTLAYIWFSENDMLNLDIVCAGYAMPLKIRPNVRYADEIKECYESAKSRGVGVWGN